MAKKRKPKQTPLPCACGKPGEIRLRASEWICESCRDADNNARLLTHNARLYDKGSITDKQRKRMVANRESYGSTEPYRMGYMDFDKR